MAWLAPALLLLACAADEETGAAKPRVPDEPTSTWYPDADGDGFGDTLGAFEAADRPGGYQAVGGDCDDQDAAVHPGADELCNGTDDNCDGTTDTDALDLIEAWPDDDGDGFGDPVGSFAGCAVPSGAVAAGGEEDCDDDNAGVAPGAPEQCGNGVDDNCDGTAAGCSLVGEVDLGTDVVRLVGTAEGGTGAAVLAPGDLDGDGIGDLVVTAPNQQAEGADHEGVAWILRGPILSGGDPADLAWARIVADEADGFAYTAAAGDLDSDGAPELVLSYPYADGPRNSVGRVLVFAGPFVEGTIGASSATGDFLGQVESGYLGGAAVSGEDLSGDGVDDLLLGSTGSLGGAWVVSGPASGQGLIGDTAAAWVVSGWSDEVGCDVASPGDVDGDGLADLAVLGCQVDLEDTAYGSEGAAFLFAGPVSGERTMEDADLRLDAASGGSLTTLVTIGDTNGDGLADLSVTATDAPLRGDGTGASWIWTDGHATGTRSLADAPTAVAGPLDGTCTVAVAGGDIDGDGVAELFFGGAAEESYRGLVVAGPTPLGRYGVDEVASARLDQAVGNRYDAGCGGWTARMDGDVTGDGRSDLVLGLRYADDGDNSVGSAYVLSAVGW